MSPKSSLQRDETLRVEQRAKARLILIFSMEYDCESSYRGILLTLRVLSECQKSYPGITGSWQPSVHSGRCFLILRVGFSLSWAKAEFPKGFVLVTHL
ncbi:hypothetical protein JTE90_027697 [Oedothorax gibbosus]|uniref:Uncharacterized protein n=1 Tax=Oedothorax gibbosus TaxID=931172 RepID=A0AAV6TD60_9ARAC|nr:hypothetical protein JTE90_027697 [Oedothorax gibbosus]